MKEKLQTLMRDISILFKLLRVGPEIARSTCSYYMIFIGICSQGFFYLQAYKIFKNCSAENLSLPGFVMALVCTFNWFVYSLIIRDKPLFISNLIGCIGVTLNIVGILIYR